MKYPNIHRAMLQRHGLDLTDEQIENFAKAHRMLQKEVRMDGADTTTRNRLADVIAEAVLGPDGRWPVNQDDELFCAAFLQQFKTAAPKKGIRLVTSHWGK